MEHKSTCQRFGVWRYAWGVFEKPRRHQEASYEFKTALEFYTVFTVLLNLIWFEESATIQPSPPSSDRLKTCVTKVIFSENRLWSM